jgi:MFS transporter, DHA3 family, macrolide efflux protein
MDQRRQPTGMTAFTIIWFGQFVSLLGSGMTTFAISIWAWEETGKATVLALAMFFGFGPQVLLSPLAGAIVDRYDRKLVMIASDLAAGLSTIALFILLNLDQLEIWHLYVANAFAGSFGAFQFPAYSAAVTLMIPKEQYGRANGMIGLAGSASGIFAPIIAGAMIGLIGIGGIMTFDIITFTFAIAMIMLVHIPQPKQSEEGQAAKGSLWQESLFGFKYIFARPSLLGLQSIFFFINLTAMFSFSLTVPLILARTGNDELILGSAQSLAAVGGVGGGLLLSLWGGPKRRVYGVLGGMFLTSLLGAFPMGIGQSLFWWALGGFMTGFIIPILNGSNQAIWQAKVQPDVQGRVFAVRRLIAQISAPIAMLSAGPLADRVFEPAMVDGGSLAGAFGWLVGTGPGAGMGLMFVITATLGALIALAGFLFPSIRNVEDIMPDHDAVLQIEEMDKEMEAVPV